MRQTRVLLKTFVRFVVPFAESWKELATITQKVCVLFFLLNTNYLKYNETPEISCHYIQESLLL